MGLEYIVQPQVFLGGLTALGPGIQGLTEQYPLLTTYYSWTSTNSNNDADVWPIPIEAGSIYDGPGKEASFIVSVGGVIQSPTEYTVDTVLRTITFNNPVSADIEVAVTQLATASPSSQSFDYIESVDSNITNLTAGSVVADSILVSNLTALSSVLEITDIQFYEISGFNITGNLNVDTAITTSELTAGNVTITSLTATAGDITLQNITTDAALITDEFVTNSVITNLTATNVFISNNIDVLGDLTVQNNSTVQGSLTVENDIYAVNTFSNLDGTIQIKNQSIPTRGLREYFTLKAAVDRSLRTIFVVTSGSGYTTTPLVSVAPPTEPWGRQALAQAILDGNAVTRIEVTDVGSGYTDTPVVTISGDGSDATAVALCDGNPLGEIYKRSNCIPSNYNTVVLGNDGNLYGWGINTTDGELGNGNVAINQASNPFVFSRFSDNATSSYIPRVVKFWRSFSNTYVLDQNGTLWGCGDNAFGQLGQNDTNDRRFLTPISPQYFNNRPIIDFAVSDGEVSTTCLARTIDNEVYGWGHNAHGALGLGDTSNKNIPTPIITPTSNAALLPLSASVEQIYCLGGQEGSVVDSSTVTFFVFTSGFVYAAGYNNNTDGTLGIGTSIPSPYKVTSLSAVRLGAEPLSGIKTIVGTGDPLAGFTAFFLDNNDTLYATGYNTNGALGLGNSTTNSNRSVSAVTTNVEKVYTDNDYAATTLSYTYIIKKDGTLYSWGRNEDSMGQLGLDLATATNIDIPTQLLSATNDVNEGNPSGVSTRYLMSSGKDGINWSAGSVADIALCHESTAVLRTDGSIYVAGNNIGGQLGTGDAVARYILQRIPDCPRPVKYIGFAGAANIAALVLASSLHFIAITDDGSIYITGCNTNRQVYPSSSHSNNFYTFVPVPLGTPIQSV